MKRIVFILFVLIVFILIRKSDSYIIPDEAIRFRIIANSNDIGDQFQKNQIKQELELELKSILKNANDYNDANLLISNNLERIKSIIDNKTTDYSINLGLNYFPEKEYKKVIYPEGNYYSLVVQLGSGLGNNWWCVLYPPLCFIDENNISETEYSFFVKELFNKIKTH